jgi:hypothetical protein
VKKQQHSNKIIPLPLGSKRGKIEQGNTDQVAVPTLNCMTAGTYIPTQILERSRHRREAMKISRKTCGVRGDKIQALKERIEAGDYRVEPEAVAEKLLEHALCELAPAIPPTYTNQSDQSHDQRRKPASL